jgi:hypothetical protein
MRTRFVLGTLLSLVLTQAAPRAAFAADAPAEDPRRAEARAHFERGGGSRRQVRVGTRRSSSSSRRARRSPRRRTRTTRPCACERRGASTRPSRCTRLSSAISPTSRPKSGRSPSVSSRSSRPRSRRSRSKGGVARAKVVVDGRERGTFAPRGAAARRRGYTHDPRVGRRVFAVRGPRGRGRHAGRHGQTPDVGAHRGWSPQRGRADGKGPRRRGSTAPPSGRPRGMACSRPGRAHGVPSAARGTSHRARAPERGARAGRVARVARRGAARADPYRAHAGPRRPCSSTASSSVAAAGRGVFGLENIGSGPRPRGSCRTRSRSRRSAENRPWRP